MVTQGTGAGTHKDFLVLAVVRRPVRLFGLIAGFKMESPRKQQKREAIYEKRYP